MAGTVFREALNDLQREGLFGDAQQIEGKLWERSLLHRLVGQSHCRHGCFGVVAGTAIRDTSFLTMFNAQECCHQKAGPQAVWDFMNTRSR